MKLTVTRLFELLDYNKDTGVFTWVGYRSNRTKKGAIAGNLNTTGYIDIGIDGAVYRAHRLAWMYVKLRSPDKSIDHINGVKTDNRICNLREATTQQNNMNRGVQSNNKTGLKGVGFIAKTNKFRARICVNGKELVIGTFDSKEQAHFAYISYAKQLHKEFSHI